MAVMDSATPGITSGQVGMERDATGICVESVESGPENVRAAEIRVCFTPFDLHRQKARPKQLGAKNGVMQRGKESKIHGVISHDTSVATGEKGTGLCCSEPRWERAKVPDYVGRCSSRRPWRDFNSAVCFLRPIMAERTYGAERSSNAPFSELHRALAESVKADSDCQQEIRRPRL